MWKFIDYLLAKTMEFRMETYEFGIGMPDDLGEGLIHYCHGIADGSQDLSIIPERYFLGFIFNLGSNIHFNTGERMTIIAKRHYVLAYIPQGTYHLTLDTGRHSLLCIEFTIPWLDRLRALFPVLTEFMRKIKTEDYAICSEPCRITPRVHTLIEFTLHNDFTDAARELLIGTKYMLISMDSLRLMQASEGDPLEVKKIRDAYEYLTKNIQFPCNVNALADRVGMTAKKLEKAFKRIYGVTVYKALTNERLNRSVYYLRDSNLPITEIAPLVGYKNADVLYSTFKRNFGYPPGELRKKADK